MCDLDTVEKIRGFNRFYTSVMSLLNSSYLNSDFSVTEARILYEIYENKGCNANFLAQKLNIDKSYVSRVIKKFESRDILKRVTSKEDTRAYHIMLANEGTAETEKLIDRSNKDILRMVHNLSAAECRKLEDAIDTVMRLLSKGTEEQ